MRIPLQIRECKPNELPPVIERLDQEFVFGKLRSLSLSKRFPNTLFTDNIPNIRVAVLDGVICGALSIRMFDWVVEKHTWRGAMVGMVWVDSQHRGKGIGSNLLSSATRFLHETDVDFGVLWTGTPAFYERAGWFLSDCGLFGELANHPPSPCIDAVSCRPLVSVDGAWLERLRSNSLPMRVIRNALDYRTIPIPAVQVLCFSAQSKDSSEGFALVGEQDGIGYFYEMIAPPSLWGIIWTAVTERFGRLFVNGHSDDPFAQWLTESRLVLWRPQNKTMWFRVSGRIEGLCLDAWHIPYFDWI
jgi:GNAT superfamily N-acetyltransferase